MAEKAEKAELEAGREGSPSDSGAPEEESQRRPKKKSRLETHEYPLNITAMMDMMTIILVYLLKSYSSDPNNVQTSAELKLPNSTTKFRVEEAVPVAITKKAILVSDKGVVNVSNGRVAAADKGGKEDGMLITPLLEAMKKEPDKQKMIAKYNKNQDFKGLVLIIGDEMVPFRLLTEVLYTVGQAEFGQYKFAVTMQNQ
jgi:biopolymer transport protein ExbD